MVRMFVPRTFVGQNVTTVLAGNLLETFLRKNVFRECDQLAGHILGLRLSGCFSLRMECTPRMIPNV
jgi:hypothetical protein